jgi:hypothetical protein
MRAGMIEEAAGRQATETLCAHVALETENGFRVVRVCEATSDQPAEPSTYRFLVFDRDGREREVVVEFEPAVVASLQQCRRPPLAPGSLFWLACAEHTLAAYLWEKNECPADGQLIIQAPCMEDVELALRWNN